jgi:PPOX class probable F420-dependent enzyme
MTVSLPDQVRRLLDEANIVTVGTVNPDGGPQTSILWATYDGDDILLSTIEGRAKHRNWLRDPRVSVLVHDKADVYTYVEVRGTITMTTEGGDELINRLSNLYMDQDYTGDLGTDHVRVVVRVTPTHVFVR